MDVSRVIKQIRQELRLSQTAFAKTMHVSFSTVNRWENRRAAPNRLATVTMIELCKKEQVKGHLLDALKEFEQTVRSSDSYGS